MVKRELLEGTNRKLVMRGAEQPYLFQQRASERCELGRTSYFSLLLSTLSYPNLDLPLASYTDDVGAFFGLRVQDRTLGEYEACSVLSKLQIALLCVRREGCLSLNRELF